MKRAETDAEGTPRKRTKRPAPTPLPATWRALRLVFPPKTRAAVARAFRAGGVTREDVLALEIAVLRELLAEPSKHARYLAPHLQHMAALEAAIREQR